MDKKAQFLVVDDEPGLRQLTARMLQVAGYETAVAASGDEALAMVRQTHPDLVISDVEMPGMQGIELCRQIKADPALAGILVILISGRRITSEDETTGLYSGADGYLTRPFEREDFLAHIAAFVRLHQAEAKLRQTNQQLEQQVKARTAELQNSVSQLQLQVTRSEQAEQEAQQLRQELFHVARASTLGELTAALAHELNQPLTAILANAQAAQLLLNQPAVNREELREIMADIIADDQRAGDIIRHTRALLKKEALEFQWLDLNALIREVVALLRTEAVLNNAAIHLALAADLPQVSADRIQVQQVILNLMVNAMDALKGVNERERRISIRSHQMDPQTVRVTVEDTGIGIPADKMERLFSLYYTSKPGGMGMGLSICSSIIKAHGGRIWAGNNNGPGAVFGFVLPLNKERSPTPAASG